MPAPIVISTGTFQPNQFVNLIGGSITVQVDAALEAGMDLTANQLPFVITIGGVVDGNGGHAITFEHFNAMTPHPNSKVSIGTEGIVSSSGAGGYGIFENEATDVANAGAIYGGNSGIYITNQVVAPHHVGITNAKSGTIVGGVHGIFDGSSTAVTISNAGLISGGLSSLDLTGPATITNSGVLAGDVYLGGSSDKLTDSGAGTIIGNIRLGGGDDSFTGGNSAETVFDGAGHDSCKLGGGNDVYWARSGGPGAGDLNDTVDGGAGFDIYHADDSVLDVWINLDTKIFNFQLLSIPAQTATGSNLGSDIGTDKITGFEFIVGSNVGNDTIAGGAAADSLGGLGGNDRLFGQGGNDFLYGDNGNDFLNGGLGADTMTGGAGFDTFVFLTLKDSGTTRTTRDTITDFIHGTDQVDLSAIDINPAHPGPDHVNHFETTINSNFNHTAGDVRWLSVGTQTVLEIDANGDGTADFSVALDGNPTISLLDVIL